MRLVRTKTAWMLLLAMILCASTASTVLAHDPNGGSDIGEALSVSAGVDFATQYFFRGIFQENQGSIVQPWAELGVNLFEGEDTINSIDLSVGIWNSIHSGPSGADNFGGGLSSPTSWYEADFYAGLSVAFAEKFEFGFTYTNYTSPNSAFTDVEDIAFSLGFDDADCWGDTGIPGFEGLQPSVTLLFEVDGQADGGVHDGTYFQFDIEPSMLLVDNDDLQITFSVPFTLGLSLDDYYEDGTGSDDTFGYVDLGFKFSMPLDFIPPAYGEWSAHAGVHVLFLGDSLETISMGAGDGDSTEVYGLFGIDVAF